MSVETWEGVEAPYFGVASLKRGIALGSVDSESHLLADAGIDTADCGVEGKLTYMTCVRDHHRRPRVTLVERSVNYRWSRRKELIRVEKEEVADVDRQVEWAEEQEVLM